MAFNYTPGPPSAVKPGAVAAALALGVAAPSRSPTYVMAPSIEATIWRHARSSVEEVAGILAGRAWVDADPERAVVSIEAAIPAEQHVETSSVHVTFKDGAWDSIASELDLLAGSPIVVGWYHTHPNLGAFFSSTDRATQASAFRQPWQIGIVLDPNRHERVAFRGPDSEPIDPDAIVAPQLPAGVPIGPPRVSPQRRVSVAIGIGAAMTGVLLVVRRLRKSARPDELE